MPDASLDRLRQIVAMRLSRDVADIQASTNPVDDLGADSLDLAELAMDIEDAFGLGLTELPDPLPKTVGAIAEAVDKLLASR